MDSLLQQAVDASLQQTAASKDISDEVRSKMGDIDEKVSEAEKQFDEFISGDFDNNVINALTIDVYLDPAGGNDGNKGLSSDQPIQSSERLQQLLNSPKYKYEYANIYIMAGSDFFLTKGIRANQTLTLRKYGDGERPVIRQGLLSNVQLSAKEVYLLDVDIHTYKASQNEELIAPSYQGRALFVTATSVTSRNASIYVCDNQLFHIHNGGSGCYFKMFNISFFNTEFVAVPSEIGVTGAYKKAFTYFVGKPSYPLDLFGAAVTVTLNGVHENLQDFLGFNTQNLRTNLTLA